MDTADRIEHKIDDLQGQAKEQVGDVTDNHNLQAEGIAEQAKATADKAVDDIRDTTDDQQ